MIFLGADHGGYPLKEKLKSYLEEEGHAYRDMGNLDLDPKDDYPDFAFAVAQEVSQNAHPEWGRSAKGILLCRSAAGMVIAANKVEGIRAASVFDEKSTKHARQHNDVNVIALSGDWLDEEQAFRLVSIFLRTSFSDEERHRRRLQMITKFENEH